MEVEVFGRHLLSNSNAISDCGLGTASGIMILMLTYLQSSHYSLYGIYSRNSSHIDANANEINIYRKTNKDKNQMTCLLSVSVSYDKSRQL